ncbi:MAG: hypothetical protein LBI49_15050 [Nocardiopsaceae bacterium]|nr:hypothetical protein [Nocardiopsaceae bacterium]
MPRQRFDLLDIVPAPLQGHILDFNWSHERLWALDLPARPMAVAQLRWLLSLPWWSYQRAHFVISPEQVRSDPSRYHEQYDRTMAADLSLPIHLLSHDNRVTTILDGVHRLLKADLTGRQVINTKQVTTACLDLIARS